MAYTFTPGSATIGTTEYFLASASTTATYQTTDCTLQAWIDFTNLTASEEYQVSLYEKINGSSALLIARWSLVGAQAQSGWTMPAMLLGEGWEVGVKKISGTDRSIGWSLRTVT